MDTYEELDSPVYYRPQLHNGHVRICCLQWFDEYDYDKSKWLTDEKFRSEREAEDWVMRQKLIWNSIKFLDLYNGSQVEL